MPQAKGSNARIIYDQESAFKQTPGVPDAKVLHFITEGLMQKRTLVRTNVIRQNRNAVKPKLGNKEVSGSITTELTPYLGILYLKHLLGSVVTTGVGPYEHTGKVGNLPVGLCLEKGFSDVAQYFLYNGVRINRSSFEFRPEGVVPLTMDYIGAKETLSGSSFDSTPVDLGHDPWDGAEMSIQEGGSAIAVVTNVKLDIENQLDGGLYVIGGNGERRAIPEGATLVSGTLTALFEDAALITKAVNYTESSLKITLARGDGLGSARNESLEILVPELLYEPNSPAIAGPQGVLIELPFAAYYENGAEATSIQMKLKNTQVTL